jgi:hypothetical protein
LILEASINTHVIKKDNTRATIKPAKEMLDLSTDAIPRAKAAATRDIATNPLEEPA